MYVVSMFHHVCNVITMLHHFPPLILGLMAHIRAGDLQILDGQVSECVGDSNTDW